MNTMHDNASIQTCNDIDECAIDNGGCDSRMPCVNTVVRIVIFKNCLYFYMKF